MSPEIAQNFELTPQVLRSVRENAGDGGGNLVQQIQAAHGLTDEALRGAVGRYTGLQTFDLAALKRLSYQKDLLSYADMLRHECIVFEDTGDAVLVVIADPFDAARRSWLYATLKRPLRIGFALGADVALWLKTYESGLLASDFYQAGASGEAEDDDGVEKLSYLSISEDQHPVIKLVNSTVYDALKADASDIHLQSTPAGMAIKFRVDGVLLGVGSVATVELAEQVISRIKILSDLDISERRVPHDGRFRVSLDGHAIDLRVSIIPGIHGEDAVLRILDKASLRDKMAGLSLASLGFDAEACMLLRKMATEPYGMMLVTGPTGSGKTTTLYAALSEINKGDEKIITIEDPVEYQLPGVLQIPVNEKKGLTFARGLRSILRHDPDKIMVGEIRDAETAQIAIQSALTGHLVFTTVHANNVFDVISRFTHMGVDMYSLVSALNGVLAQRLVRINCEHCAVPATPLREDLAKSKLLGADLSTWNYRAGPGCSHCFGSGYRGRKAISEILYLNDDLRELIASRAPIRALKEAALQCGTKYLRDSAVNLVRNGLTTLSEINRVTFVS